VEGDKKIKWICGCFQTVDNYFKFCEKHAETLKRAIQSQVDELDMTLLIEDKN
jgi:predicted transcriptional regulator